MAVVIDDLPPVPTRSDPDFSAKADTLLGAFPTFIDQTNALAQEAEDTAILFAIVLG